MTKNGRSSMGLIHGIILAAQPEEAAVRMGQHGLCLRQRGRDSPKVPIVLTKCSLGF